MKTYPLMCHIRAEAATTRIDVYDEIGDGGMFGEGVSAKDFAAQLASVKGPLDVHINSYGGSVKDGIAITSAIRAHKAPKRTIVDGMACSAASVIMQAGDERIVQPGAMVMIHDASTGIYGNATEMAKVAEELDKFSDNIAKVYADRAGGTPEQWRAAMRDETWYTADEALGAGLADRIGDGSASLPGELDLSAFASVPERVMARLREMPLRQPKAAYQPQPYERESWENVLCPVCGKYNDDDAIYCGQCGIELAGRDDVQGAPSEPDDDDMNAKRTGGVVMNGPEGSTITVDLSGALYPEPILVTLRQSLRNAAVDESDWDGPHAMSLAAKSDDPAAAYKQICAGRREGDASKQESWALPYKYPGKGPNADGVKAALGRLTQTQGLTNEAEAKALLQRLMKQINPDYEPSDHAALPAWLAHDSSTAAPAWMQPAQEAR